jgi:hypothetical protein
MTWPSNILSEEVISRNITAESNSICLLPSRPFILDALQLLLYILFKTIVNTKK